jgi:hypothetical protein
LPRVPVKEENEVTRFFFAGRGRVVASGVAWIAVPAGNGKNEVVC